MVKVKVLEINAKTGKSKVVERDIEIPPQPKRVEGVDLTELAKLIKYAKSKGWI